MQNVLCGNAVRPDIVQRIQKEGVVQASEAVGALFFGFTDLVTVKVRTAGRLRSGAAHGKRVHGSFNLGRRRIAGWSEGDHALETRCGVSSQLSSVSGRTGSYLHS